ncbi:NUDIX domain-containing protein [Candidatus Uabimicrobium sp. HlEnr_7]|uniref:NUDIX domain-containing protein n=1 Tax=Candidatus Uabimicrobium helgolandensis TaxID=3095367 RepID=UPI0035577E17
MNVRNEKCLENYPEYPKRSSIEDPYNPVYFNHTDNNSRSYADPESLEEVQKLNFKSHAGEVKIESGYPQNPVGRTGMTGRGILAKWGANFGADAIITRNSKDLEVLLVKRKDTEELAVPGGMIDEGETSLQTAQRELKEETGIELDMSTAKKIYEGYVDDPRNTDNAWIETSVYHLHVEGCNSEITVQHSEVIEASFVKINDALKQKMFASHRSFLNLLS